ncbi:GNAT family N-acetyltransferase [Pseudomonas sp. SJZ079]|uniref:GNAT family N-acetyltransferase n=1 Tax=Pseudomonas sp. SJZ079 TaxID=2572887 RepID=UPI002115775E|nr:GNAT family N-acetyltransferase [Pseudomonas sp. SJZ079]
MQTPDYLIRTMTRQELDIAIDWAAIEGWNPGLYDAECFYAADPSGFLIGVLGDEPVSVISVVRYGATFGFLGFYIVKPEHRGKGYGLQIWNAGLEYLKGRTIGLDGVVAQQDNYMKSGFTWAHANVRYQGIGGGCRHEDADIVPLSAVSIEAVCAYDRAFFPEPRRQFLRCWTQQPESTALGILRDRQLAGYGVLRRCRSGYKIGPLFADTAELAEPLFLALKAEVPVGAPVFLDTPAVNSAAIEMAQRHNMFVSFETARMYRGQPPALPMNRVFGVTTFELG